MLQGAKVNSPTLQAINWAHGQALPFKFSEFDEEVIKTLNIEKPVPQTLEVINVEDADATRFGHVTPIQPSLHAMYITFGG